MSPMKLGVTLLVAALLGHCEAWRVAAPGTARLTRRQALVATTAAVLPTPAFAEEDELVKRLVEVRQSLAASSAALDNKQYDAVRLAVKNAATPLTIKGYLGDSVKARAQSLGPEGGGKELAALRKELILSLAVIDNYCYQRQAAAASFLGGGGEDAGDPKVALETSLTSLDTIVVRLSGGAPAAPAAD